MTPTDFSEDALIEKPSKNRNNV